ncbi:Transmembrane CLPTM1 family protein [Striga hermonthica]|uniref:Transmembrane CLPTM1 family protein n=1 Tax=Striga hermonthica TaxID=68872 RepID=A0A9N7RKA6_STRHE|nr:Transmembrane CLPTM1 family protein [Striga hermonthica]
MEPPATVGDGGGGGTRRQQQQQQGAGSMLTGIIRVAVFWYFASKFFGPKRPPPQSSHQISNLFHKGEPLVRKFVKLEASYACGDNIPYAVWTADSTRTLSLKYYPSEALKHNGSLYAHVFFARSGYPPDPKDPEFQPLAAFGRTHPLVTYLPKRADKKKSLLGNSKDAVVDEKATEVPNDSNDDDKEDGPVEWMSYWKPNVTINLVDDFTRYSQNAIPPHIAPCILGFPLVVRVT